MNRDYAALKAELYATADPLTRAALDRMVAGVGLERICNCGPEIVNKPLEYHNGPSCERFQAWRDDIRIDRAVARRTQPGAGGQ